MKTEEIRIEQAGVMRCCLATVAKEHEGKEVEPGAKSACEHCKTAFTLTEDYIWKPDWQLEEGK